MPTKRQRSKDSDVEALRAELDAPLGESTEQLLERASQRAGRQLFTVPQAREEVARLVVKREPSQPLSAPDGTAVRPEHWFELGTRAGRLPAGRCKQVFELYMQLSQGRTLTLTYEAYARIDAEILELGGTRGN